MQPGERHDATGGHRAHRGVGLRLAGQEGGRDPDGLSGAQALDLGLGQRQRRHVAERGRDRQERLRQRVVRDQPLERRER